MSDVDTIRLRLVRTGAAIKALRTEKGLTLAEVSEKTGLPVSTLSKAENDKIELTVEKLLRITLALGADAASLFTPTRMDTGTSQFNGRRCITREGEGQLVESETGSYRYQAYELLSKMLVPIVGEVRARTLAEFGEFHKHPGEEYVHVIEGEMALYTDIYTPVYLKAGDGIYFDSNMGHAYIAVGPAPCRMLSMCVSAEDDLIKLMERKSKPLGGDGGVRSKP